MVNFKFIKDFGNFFNISNELKYAYKSNILRKKCHSVQFSPISGQNLPFFGKLYNSVQSKDIFMMVIKTLLSSTDPITEQEDGCSLDEENERFSRNITLLDKTYSN